MTLVEKLRVAQGDNAELCHVAADALDFMTTGFYACDCCSHNGDACVLSSDCPGFDWQGNNDSVQPHIEAQKKRKLVYEQFLRIGEVAKFVNERNIQHKDICSLIYCDIFYIIWYWKDVETE